MNYSAKIPRQARDDSVSQTSNNTKEFKDGKNIGYYFREDGQGF